MNQLVDGHLDPKEVDRAIRGQAVGGHLHYPADPGRLGGGKEVSISGQINPGRTGRSHSREAVGGRNDLGDTHRGPGESVGIEQVGGNELDPGSGQGTEFIDPPGNQPNRGAPVDQPSGNAATQGASGAEDQYSFGHLFPPPLHSGER